jgi:hypothetical protein
MKNINQTIKTVIRTAGIGVALAMVFTIAFTAPNASANYSSYGYGSNSGYGNNYGNNYGNSYGSYNNGYTSHPVYYPVYYQTNYPVQQPIYTPVPVPVPTPVYTPVYQQPVYQQPVYNYNPLTVSCYANPVSATVNQSVTWQAYASGGSGSYSYTWSGTNSYYGSTGSSVYSTYSTPGSYSASVTVYSNGQTATQSCGSVIVTDNYYVQQPTYYQQPVYQAPVQQTSGDLVAACFADRTAATVNQSVTWAVEVTGGSGQYSYSWSGTDGLSGSGSTVSKNYDTTGTKNAAVLISSGGQTLSQACGDAVSIRTYVAPSVTNYQGPPTSSAATENANNPNALSANALFSLGSIPWGWIAILIILILFVSVFYLLFNRHKV